MKISKSEYRRRRKNLMAMMEPNSIALIPAAGECTRSRDTEYTFRQDSDFLYLTGFEEPDGVLVLIPGRRAGQVVLFCRDRDPEMELWNGYRAGPEGAVADYGMDDAFPIDDIDDILPGLLEGKQHIYYSMGHNDAFDRRVMAWVNQIRRQIRTGAKPPGDFTDLAFLLHELVARVLGDEEFWHHALDPTAVSFLFALGAAFYFGRPGGGGERSSSGRREARHGSLPLFCATRYSCGSPPTSGYAAADDESRTIRPDQARRSRSPLAATRPGRDRSIWPRVGAA